LTKSKTAEAENTAGNKSNTGFFAAPYVPITMSATKEMRMAPGMSLEKSASVAAAWG
jgi:hypothetical protein